MAATRWKSSLIQSPFSSLSGPIVSNMSAWTQKMLLSHTDAEIGAQERIFSKSGHDFGSNGNRQQTSNIRSCEVQIPNLHCDGRVFHAGVDRFNQEGFLCSGLLDRVIQSTEPYPGCFQEPVVQLFGSKYITGSALVSHGEQLFYLLRQQIFKLESVQSEGRTWPLSDEGNTACLEIRKTCSKFMAYVHHFIANCLVHPSEIPQVQENPFLMQLAAMPGTLQRELEELSIFLGSLSELPSSCYLRADTVGIISSRLPPGSHLFHLYMNLKWSVVQAMVALLSREEEKAGSISPVLAELNNSLKNLTMELLWDLVSVAAVVFDKAGRADALKTSPFPCACACEVWVMLLTVLDHLATKTNIQSFWSAVSSLLTAILSSRDPLHSQPDSQDTNLVKVPPTFSCRDPVSLCWWLVVEIAPLYWVNRRGAFAVKKKGSVAGNWVFVVDLLKSSLNSIKESHEEAQRRFFVTCCLMLSQHWSANPGLIVWLWDYFHRRLNETFHIPGQSLHGLAIVSSSALKWMEKCFNRSTVPSNPVEGETSYSVFLNMVAAHLSKLLHSGSMQGWKQMKGRFYSKFHKRRMEELNETGLHNFISLFLTIASVAELEDVAAKMCSFLDLLDFTSLAPAKRVFIWRGLFSLMLIYKERSVELGYLAEKMAGSFIAVTAEFGEVHSHDKARQRHLWELITIYLDSSIEMFEHKNKQELGHTKLLGEGFSALFKSSRENELRYLLEFVKSLLTIVSSEQELSSSGMPRRNGAMSCVLWERLFPYLETMANDRHMVKTAPHHLADTMAGFALLAFKRHPRPISDKQVITFIGLLTSLGLEEDQDSSFCCRFLHHVLPTSGVAAVLQSEGLQARVIHAWFRCLIQLPPTHEGCQSLSRFVVRLPEMDEIINSKAEFVSSKNSEKTLKIFLSSLGTFHGNLALYGAIQFRERAQAYLGDVTKYLDPFLSNAGPQESLRMSYSVAGSLVKYCYKIIYSKTQPRCLLPRLLDQLIMPLTGSKKAMPPAVKQYAISYLHLFLQGLRCLDFRRDDFIKRKIRQIFEHYFLIETQRWHSSYQSGSVTVKHQFMAVLKDSLEQVPSQDASDFRQFVVDLIKDSFLQFNNFSTFQQLTPTLCFLEHLFRTTRSPKENARNSPSLLVAVLLCLMTCNSLSPSNEPPSIRRHASEILRLIMESCNSCASSGDSNPRDQLLPSLRSFIFNHIKQSQGLVFKTCESVAVLSPGLLTSLVPDMRQAIIQSEETRGVGNDSQLRTAFKVLLQQIGVQLHDFT